jgi:predicted TPR repeat methyltransferase
VAARVNEQVSAAEAKERNAYTLAMAVYRDLIELAPRDQTLQLELAQTAEGARDYEAAAAAYEKFLELAPDDSTAPAVRERLRQLRAATSATG